MEVISAWQIYLVLQLDSFGCALSWGVVLSVVAAVAAFCVWCFRVSQDPEEWGASLYRERAQRAKDSAPEVMKVLRKIVIFGFLPSLIASSALPSTKTAAAMFVIPAIANNEHIQTEAGELYKLAKDALREAAKPEEAKSKGAK